jgi:hypothetical protein
MEVPDFTQKQRPNIQTPPFYFGKSEYDLQSIIVNPASKTSFESTQVTNKDGSVEIGLVPTTFDEVNTTDLPTANFDEKDVAYAGMIATILDFYQFVAKEYNIDTRASHQLLRRELSLMASITKGRDFTLGKHILVKRTAQRQEYTDHTQRKKGIFGMGKEDNLRDEW